MTIAIVQHDPSQQLVEVGDDRLQMSVQQCCQLSPPTPPLTTEQHERRRRRVCPSEQLPEISVA